MTWANRITVFRILLIPLFVTVMIYYGNLREEWLRVLSCAVFVVAAVSDGVDGYLARQYNQRSELGTFLDPLADKALLVSAIVLLTVNHGNAFESLPAWFAVTVISRDLILGIGALMIHLMVGEVKVRPRVVGKISTVCQMIVLAWTMLKIPRSQTVFHELLALAGATAIVSGLWYIYDGAQQIGKEGKPSA